MVSIDYRLEYNVTKEQVLNLFKTIGYFHVRSKKKSVKKGGKWLAAEEFIKVDKGGRFHIFIEFSTKSSGTEPYPQVDVHAHYDYFKKKGEKEVHVTRRNLKRDLDEMYDIHRALKEAGYGHMEFKSHSSAHDTIKNNYLKFFIEELQPSYEYDKDGKYKKKIENGQITVQIIEQRRYSHIVCVYAIGDKHDLFRDNALEELNRIMDNMYQKINHAKEIYEALKKRLKEETKRLNELKEIRDSKNLKTQELISSIKELEQEISDCRIPKKKKILGNIKKKIERELIENKKTANKDHKKFAFFRRKLDKLKKQIKNYKV